MTRRTPIKTQRAVQVTILVSVDDGQEYRTFVALRTGGVWRAFDKDTHRPLGFGTSWATLDDLVTTLEATYKEPQS